MLVEDREGLAAMGARFQRNALELYGEEQMGEQLEAELGLRPAGQVPHRG
jgi:hypothetical protein